MNYVDGLSTLKKRNVKRVWLTMSSVVIENECQSQCTELNNIYFLNTPYFSEYKCGACLPLLQ